MKKKKKKSKKTEEEPVEEAVAESQEAAPAAGNHWSLFRPGLIEMTHWSRDRAIATQGVIFCLSFVYCMSIVSHRRLTPRQSPTAYYIDAAEEDPMAMFGEKKKKKKKVKVEVRRSYRDHLA
jgi:hypothetical protein